MSDTTIDERTLAIAIELAEVLLERLAVHGYHLTDGELRDVALHAARAVATITAVPHGKTEK